VRIGEADHFSLTPDERETVITASDADDHVIVHTAQRRVITRLKKLACAELIEEGHWGTTAHASFRLPVDALSFRNPTSPEERERRRQRLIARGGFQTTQPAHTRIQPAAAPPNEERPTP
jgi:hypothetical protein